MHAVQYHTKPKAYQKLSLLTYSNHSSALYIDFKHRMELKIIVLAACLGAILCAASCQGNSFNPSLYATKISQLISDVNKNIKESQVTLRQLQEAVIRYGDAFKETSEKVEEFEKALKKITSSVRDNGDAYNKLASLLMETEK